MNATTITTTATAEPTPPACQNCGTPLLGEHCYRCGQPVKGLVRHFSSILGDFFDSVFNIDARVFRTLWPLFARPGYLSREYFAGHRIRFVSPVRLFVFLSIVTFFLAQFAFDISGDNVKVNGRNDSAFARATTVAEVEQRRDAALAELTKARRSREARGVPGVDGALIAAEVAINRDAASRIAQLRKAQGKDASPATAAEDEDTISFNGKPWDAQKNPLTVSWLPDFANRWINAQVGRAKDNMARLERDPNVFKDAVLAALPSTLFLLLPVFAGLLKLAYVFKRRLYMEHLIVALHSHAFLCLALLGLVGLNALEDVLAPSGFLNSVLGLLEGLLWLWMPLYLLLMQKRIYEQGWLMTLLKYFVLGVCYCVLLSMGVAFTMLASLVWM